MIVIILLKLYNYKLGVHSNIDYWYTKRLSVKQYIEL